MEPEGLLSCLHENALFKIQRRKAYGRRKSGGKRKKIMETIIMETKREINTMKGGTQDEDKKRNYERKKEKERNMKEK